MVVRASADISGLTASQFDITYQNAFVSSIKDTTSIHRCVVTVVNVVDVARRTLSEINNSLQSRKLVNSVQVLYDLSFVIESQPNMTSQNAMQEVNNRLQEGIVSASITSRMNSVLQENLGDQYVPIFVENIVPLSSSIEILSSYSPTSIPTAAPTPEPVVYPVWQFLLVGVGICFVFYGAYWVRANTRSSKVYIDHDHDDIL